MDLERKNPECFAAVHFMRCTGRGLTALVEL
jgi:hypothetical protein